MTAPDEPARGAVASRGEGRQAPDGRITYAPVEGEPDCLRCGLLRHFGTTPDNVLLDHINGHKVRKGTTNAR